MVYNLGVAEGNPGKVLKSDDFAELIVAGLKLLRRSMLKGASLWSINPLL